MTSVITVKSAYRMHCFSCNKPIEKGEEITQCLETGGMDLRRRSFIGARWVHQFCVPTHRLTRYYLEVLDDYHRAYSETEFGDIDTIVENLDYWDHQKS